jgi:hypothetical protein
VTNLTAFNRPFNKFAWLRAVLADDAVTLGEKAVLSYVALFDVRNDSDTFCVRQHTLASHCATSESTVSRAIRHAKRLGYLAVAQSRKPGWGQHGADVLRLTMPDKSSLKSTTDSPGWNGESPANLTVDSAESPVNPMKVTRQIGDYIKEYGSLDGFLKGGGEESQVNLTADSPRPPTCPKHPDGPNHDENCWRCGQVRKWHQQQAADQAERQRESRRAAKAVIEACTICDGTGWVDTNDESDSVRKCLCKSNVGKAEHA